MSLGEIDGLHSGHMKPTRGLPGSMPGRPRTTAANEQMSTMAVFGEMV